MYFQGASVYCSGDYETPMGLVAVDVETGKELINRNTLFSDREDAHLQEHSLEVQLPFLQKRLGASFKLVPVILGTQKPEECRRLAETLRPYFNPENLFIISSDFSHYPDYDDAVNTDRATTLAILSGSPEKLMTTLENNKQKKIPGLATSLCGWTSVLTLLYIAKGDNYTWEWIDYQNSGDQPEYGDHGRVVGYSAIAVYLNKEDHFSLTPGEKEQLLHIARESIRQKVTSGNRGEVDETLLTGHLAARHGAFVSVYVSGKLRGCIGSFKSEMPLAAIVQQVAASAACDRRFEPVSEEELEKLSVEISVISPLKKIGSPDEIILGKHGIYIKKGWSTGTFLPQVAEKYGWTKEEFLSRCSADKAGIGRDGWKTAELYIYEAIVFDDRQTNG